MIRRLVLLMLLSLATVTFAQTLDSPLSFGTPDFDPKTDITYTLLSVPANAPSGEELPFKLVLHVPHGFHVTKDLFAFEPAQGEFDVKEVTLPEGKKSIVGEVLGGDITVNIVIIPKKPMSTMPFKLTYQTCSEGENPVCFPPVTVEGKLKTTITQGNLTLEERVIRALGSSMFLALLLIFIGGIGASLTPCVYPVIPLTVAYIGARSEGQKLKGFTLSVFLVLGIATTYSILGIVSAKTGAIFGSITQSPIFIIALSTIFVAMGLSMFGYYELQLPSSINTKLQVQRKGLLGAFLMGMATGILAAPCVGPIIVALLGWVAQTGSVLKGFLYLFDFALGMGVLFILIGTFTGVLTSLPRAGNWMIRVKYTFGVLFIFAALLFAKPLLRDLYYPAMLICLLPFIIALVKKSLVTKKVGIGLLVLFILGIVSVQQFGPKAPVVPDYTAEVTNALSQAKTENRLVVLDFYADWCAACKELDEYTWSDKTVEQALKKNAILVKLDFTATSKVGAKTQSEYGVKGLPTVILLDKEGKELKRFSGFVKPDAFLKIFNEARSDAGLD